MNMYLGIDLGTSSVKLLLADAEGNILNSVTKEYPIYYPQSGWSEQNPEDWWTALVEGVNELTQNTDKALICGIGVGGQMHGLVILDENDKVIRPAILWNDGRTFKETDYLNNVIGKEKLASLTGNIAFAGFTAPKIMWVRDNEPENFATALRHIILSKISMCNKAVMDCSSLLICKSVNIVFFNILRYLSVDMYSPNISRKLYNFIFYLIRQVIL